MKIRLLVEEVDLRLRVFEIVLLQRKSCTHYRIECSVEIREIPPCGCEITDQDMASVILKSNDGSISTEIALIVHGR